jgi:hypothetical protein
LTAGSVIFWIPWLASYLGPKHAREAAGAWAHFPGCPALGLFRHFRKRAHEAAGAWALVLWCRRVYEGKQAPSGGPTGVSIQAVCRFPAIVGSPIGATHRRPAGCGRGLISPGVPPWDFFGIFGSVRMKRLGRGPLCFDVAGYMREKESQVRQAGPTMGGLSGWAGHPHTVPYSCRKPSRGF